MHPEDCVQDNLPSLAKLEHVMHRVNAIQLCCVVQDLQLLSADVNEEQAVCP